MKQLISFLIIALLVLTACNRNDSLKNETELFRPFYHFSPDSGWMNDPNGLVYYNGEYHLFYQYYPDSTIWGPMHWGHSVSNDMLHWKDFPIALFPDSLGYIFSGSAVMDLQNTSRLGDSSGPPMVAVYTYHNQTLANSGKKDFQYQGLAFSTNKGRTWNKYNENPVLPNPGIPDFRDPKVTWHGPTEKWIMTLAAGDHVSFYSSPDLLSWKHESDFGKDMGAHGGVWECPDLFELPLNSSSEQGKWVLLVSINPGAPFGGSGTQYFVGHFDGHSFTWEESATRWIDYGMDNYAGVTWSNTGNRRLFLGWMSNWAYAQKVPTHPWRSAMTVPRELSLTRNHNGYLLQSAPVPELELIDSLVAYDNLNVASDGIELVFDKGQLKAARIIMKAPVKENEKIGLTLTNNKGQQLNLGFDAGSGELWLDRTKAGIQTFDTLFASQVHKVITGHGFERVTFDLFIDQSSAELFFNGGMYVLTDLVFPEENYHSIKISTASGNTDFIDIKVYAMKKILQ